MTRQRIEYTLEIPQLCCGTSSDMLVGWGNVHANGSFHFLGVVVLGAVIPSNDGVQSSSGGVKVDGLATDLGLVGGVQREDQVQGDGSQGADAEGGGEDGEDGEAERLEARGRVGVGRPEVVGGPARARWGAAGRGGSEPSSPTVRGTSICRRVPAGP